MRPPGLINQVMGLAPGRGFAELDAIWRESHWRAQAEVGQRLQNIGVFGFGWYEQGTGGVGAGITW